MTNLLKKTLLLAGIVYAQLASAQTKADGISAIQLEEWDNAINIYTSLSKADPSDQDALLTLGNVYIAKGDNDKAAKAFQAAFDASPDGALAFVALGRMAMLQNNIAEADKQLQRASKKAKKDMVARRQIGETYVFYKAPGSKKPNFTRAEELLKEAVDVNGKDYETLMSIAYLYKEIPDGGRAAQYYEYAENVDPQNPLPKLMMALVYKSAKVPEKPIVYFNKAIALQHDYTPALRAKAEYLYWGRKWEEATLALKDLVAHGKNVTVDDEMLLANCLYITKDCKGCSELVEKILAKDGSKNYLRRLQAYCDYDNGDYARGLQILDDYFKKVSPEKVMPSDYEYHGNLLLKTKGDTTMAIADYRKAIEMDTTGSKWTLYKDIATLQYSRKNYCEGAVSYARLLDSLPTNDPYFATYLYYMGVTQYFCEDDTLRYVNAEKTFRKITEVMGAATIGWEWAAKAAEKQDPSPEEIEADPTVASQYGKARYYHEQIVERFSTDKVKNRDDLLKAFNYLAYVYFVKKDEANFNNITAKWLEMETNPDKINTINEMKAAFGKDEPATPVNVPKGGSSGRQ